MAQKNKIDYKAPQPRPVDPLRNAILGEIGFMAKYFRSIKMSAKFVSDYVAAASKSTTREEFDETTKRWIDAAKNLKASEKES